ncbi:hypothetical protein HK100_004672 [Physocladia obscura]|uniref:Uncharacterized protein n=1 Tax=Physocladia obscura TaxID=109957 RepID=A0AAD5XCU7_9FUNG|nr:hypothetical protein HK100_004672 [Physocladia obscura]
MKSMLMLLFAILASVAISARPARPKPSSVAGVARFVGDLTAASILANLQTGSIPAKRPAWERPETIPKRSRRLSQSLDDEQRIPHEELFFDDIEDEAR